MMCVASAFSSMYAGATSPEVDIECEIDTESDSAVENTVNDGKQYLVERTAYENFVRMADAARKEGISIKAVSTYRTEDYQRNLYNKKVRTTGTHNADNYSARPGFSEHQTGLAVDINSTKTSFENTNVFKWLQKTRI